MNPEWYRNRTRSGYRKYKLHVIGVWVGLADLGCQKAVNMHPTISSSQGLLYRVSYCTLRTEKARLHTKPYFPSPPKQATYKQSRIMKLLSVTHEWRGGETTFLSVYWSCSSSQSSKNQISLDTSFLKKLTSVVTLCTRIFYTYLKLTHCLCPQKPSFARDPRAHWSYL